MAKDKSPASEQASELDDRMRELEKKAKESEKEHGIVHFFLAEIQECRAELRALQNMIEEMEKPVSVPEPDPDEW